MLGLLVLFLLFFFFLPLSCHSFPFTIFLVPYMDVFFLHMPFLVHEQWFSDGNLYFFCYLFLTFATLSVS